MRVRVRGHPSPTRRLMLLPVKASPMNFSAGSKRLGGSAHCATAKSTWSATTASTPHASLLAALRVAANMVAAAVAAALLLGCPSTHLSLSTHSYC